VAEGRGRRADAVRQPGRHPAEPPGRGTLAAAEGHDDLAPLHDLLAALATPYEAGGGAAKYREPPADECGYRTFCGT